VITFTDPVDSLVLSGSRGPTTPRDYSRLHVGRRREIRAMGASCCFSVIRCFGVLARTGKDGDECDLDRAEPINKGGMV